MEHLFERIIGLPPDFAGVYVGILRFLAPALMILLLVMPFLFLLIMLSLQLLLQVTIL